MGVIDFKDRLLVICTLAVILTLGVCTVWLRHSLYAATDSVVYEMQQDTGHPHGFSP